jgi:hypothetical protein
VPNHEAKVSNGIQTRQESVMASERWGTPADEPPARNEERELVREELEGRLFAAGVMLTGSESDEQIVRLADAVEAFDAARARAGGDSMVNTPASTRPDDPRFVLPVRHDDESADRFIARIRAAADRIAP